MTDFSNSVIMPREDFIELSTVAFDNQHDITVGERVSSVIQTTAVLGAVAGMVAAASWGYVKAVDWHERKKHEREIVKLQFEIDNGLKTQ